MKTQVLVITDGPLRLGFRVEDGIVAWSPAGAEWATGQPAETVIDQYTRSGALAALLDGKDEEDA